MSTIEITDLDNLRRGDRVVSQANPFSPAVVEREVPEQRTTLTISGGPKMIREALCVAQASAGNHANKVLSALIDECDRHRPLGPDGKHGQRHTTTCGCDDIPERYRPEVEPIAPGTAGTATVAGVENVRVIRSDGEGWVTGVCIEGDRWHYPRDVTDFVPDAPDCPCGGLVREKVTAEMERLELDAAKSKREAEELRKDAQRYYSVAVKAQAVRDHWETKFREAQAELGRVRQVTREIDADLDAERAKLAEAEERSKRLAEDAEAERDAVRGLLVYTKRELDEARATKDMHKERAELAWAEAEKLRKAYMQAEPWQGYE